MDLLIWSAIISVITILSICSLTVNGLRPSIPISQIRPHCKSDCPSVRRSFSFLHASSMNTLDTGEKSPKSSDNKTTSSSLEKRLREQKLRKPPTIITCSSSKELVHAIDSVVTRDHVVAELGSQLRDVSDTIRNKASSNSVYVDVKRDFPKSQTEETTAREMQRVNSMRNDDGTSTPIDFREIKKFSEWRSTFFKPSSSFLNQYDVLVLDISSIVGNDLEWTCLDFILEFEQMAATVAAEAAAEDDSPYFGLQYVLVKSLSLNSLASQLTHTVPWLDPNKTNHRRLCRIIATVGVDNYRRTIPGVLKLLQQSHLKPKALGGSDKPKSSGEEESIPGPTNFFVVEVGCHFGTSTAILDGVFDNVMGVDVGSKVIKQAQRKHPHIFFRTGDAWKTAGLLRLQQEYYLEKEESERSSDNRKIGFDAVYVDVGGLSGADGLLDTIALVKSIQYALEPQCIVVKSLCLERLAKRFTPYWKWQKKGRNEFN